MVGNAGSGVFSLDNTAGDSYHTVGGSLVLGSQAGSSGTYSLHNTDTGGATSLTVTGDTIVGDAGSGTFNQTGYDYNNLHTTTNLILGNQNTGSGSYSLSGGSLQVISDTNVGYGGTGTFNLSDAGNLSIGNILRIGRDVGSSGSFTQSGGSLSVTDIEIGNAGRGVYSLSGGSLQVISDTNVGYGGTGTFNLSDAGNFSIGNTLNIGRDAGSSGSFTQSGGSLSSSWLALGIGGTGAFSQTGGTNTIANSLTMGSNTGATGTYALSAPAV